MSLINYISRCAITEDAVNKFRRLYEEKYGTKLDIRQALWCLGFEVERHGYDLRYGLIRSQVCRHKVFNAHYYAGIVRGNVKMEWNGTNFIPVKDDRGRFEYTHDLHPLTALYESIEVVTGDIIPDDVSDILEIGQKSHYDKVR